MDSMTYSHAMLAIEYWLEFYPCFSFLSSSYFCPSLEFQLLPVSVASRHKDLTLRVTCHRLAQ